MAFHSSALSVSLSHTSFYLGLSHPSHSFCLKMSTIDSCASTISLVSYTSLPQPVLFLLGMDNTFGTHKESQSKEMSQLAAPTHSALPPCHHQLPQHHMLGRQAPEEPRKLCGPARKGPVGVMLCVIVSD